jgi:signal transduction histidine kinase/ActR/RegA family two-component response regulator
MPDSYQFKAKFEQEIQDRLGLVPSLYLSAPAAPEVLQRFWTESIDAYLDNSLPALFKERMVVILSLWGGAYYCVVRHAGYLLGGEHGYPAGDREAAPHTVPQLIDLLRTPSPAAGAAHLQAALQLLLATPAALASLPSAGDPLEQAMFIACGAVYLDPEHNQRARDAIAHVLGGQMSEQLFALMAYVAKLHFWTRLHEDIAIEPDMRALLEQQPELAQLLQQKKEEAKVEGEAPSPVPQPAAAAAPEQRDAGHQRFISLFSHELRNPVAAISAVSDMFQVVGLADDRLRSASNILHRQVQALGQTLDRMVDLSALMYGNVQLAKAPVVMDDVIAGVLRELAPRLAEKGIAADLQAGDQRAGVIGDAARLAQMVENLVLHGLKVSRPPHALRIAVSAQERQLSIAVTDQGPGFTQSPLPEVGVPDGSGKIPVTLLIVRAIAQLHQGSVRAESAGPGKGSTTTVTLPLAATAAPAPQDGGSAGLSGAAHPDQPRLRVLAIEDNRDFAQLFRHMLEIMGCDLDITSDARSGLARARAMLPELIFCDIGLPGDMDGFAFAEAVRSEAALAHIPLVAVSGFNSPADIQRALEAGFNRVCGKPVKFADISEALATFASKRAGAA